MRKGHRHQKKAEMKQEDKAAERAEEVRSTFLTLVTIERKFNDNDRALEAVNDNFDNYK